MEQGLKNVVESAVALAAAPIINQSPALRPVALLPPGWTATDVGDKLPTPFRPSGFAKLEDAESFVGYINQMAAKQTNIYCEADFKTGKVEFKAVFNDHATASAGWKDFGAQFPVPFSVEWGVWQPGDRKAMAQESFALFLEDNMRDVTNMKLPDTPADAPPLPSGGDMLAMAKELEIAQDGRIRSTIRLPSGGVELTYVKKETDETLKKMQMFERFAIGIPVFLRGKPYRIEAKLRYRVQGPAVQFWYELIRLDLVIVDAVKETAAFIAAATNRPIWYGKA